MASDYEAVLCVKNEVFVYKIPARSSNRGYRAAEWTLDKPDWTGRLRVVSKKSDLFIKLEDKNSGDLFAQCPVECYPSVAIEQVLDSSRYFVLRISDTGRSAFVGIGFADRADSFDLMVALQDHFKWLKREETERKEATSTVADATPKLDLGFKEGQTITINLGNRKEGGSKARPRASSGGTPGLLPPPPGGVKLPAPPRGPSPTATSPVSNLAPMSEVKQGSSSNNLDFLFDLSGSNSTPATQPLSSVGQDLLGGAPVLPAPAQPVSSSDPWGDFASAGSTDASDNGGGGGINWVQF